MAAGIKATVLFLALSIRTVPLKGRPPSILITSIDALPFCSTRIPIVLYQTLA